MEPAKKDPSITFQPQQLKKYDKEDVLYLDPKHSIKRGTVNMITGPASSGKTQLCYYFAVQTVLPKDCGGHNSNVLYWALGKPFVEKKANDLINSALCKGLSQEAPKKIFFPEIKNKSVLDNHLNNLEGTIRSMNIKTIIIDAINPIVIEAFEHENQNGEKEINYSERNKFLDDGLLKPLTKCAKDFGLFVFVVNNVSEIPADQRNKLCYLEKIGESFRPCFDMEFWYLFDDIWLTKKEKSNDTTLSNFSLSNIFSKCFIDHSCNFKFHVKSSEIAFDNDNFYSSSLICQ